MDILQLLVYGIVLGSILALGAIGVSLIFGILRFAHFAHGDMMTLGAYAALIFVSMGVPVLAALPLAMIIAAAMAVLLDQTVYRRLRRTSPVILLISSFGMALGLRSLIQLIWGPSNQFFAQGIQMPYWIGGRGGLAIKPDHILIVGGAIVLVVIVHIFLSHTRMGKAMRAMSDNVDLAAACGIPSERVVIWTWILAASLATAAGVFVGLDSKLHPVMGWSILLPIFAASILGGIGKPYGAIAGGMVIGIAMEMSTLVISPAYKPAVAFAIMVAVLIWRPQGILKGQA